MEYSGKAILVTGAASGIGRAVAEHLADNGSGRLILVDRDQAALEALHFRCDTRRVASDVADPSLWAGTDVDGIDHAVINAGVSGAAPIAELEYSEWRRIISANLDGAFLSLQAALRGMNDGGSIVTVASAAAFKAEHGIAAYASSKAALVQLSRVAAKENAARGIRINVVAPGGVETPMWESPEFLQRAREIGRDAAFAEIAAMGTPLGRFARPDEVACQIAFLLSDSAATITGATLVSDGGYLL